MSYTAPQYVDTKSQAILALASTIADEDKTALGDGSVNKALDVLADVLAESDVQVPQTNAGAILALAQYVNSGGGGGGGGETVDVNIWNVTEGESLMSVLPTEVSYVTGVDEIGNLITSDPLSFEHITDGESDTLIHGIKVSSLPVGAVVELAFTDADVSLEYLGFGFTENGAADERLAAAIGGCVPAPISDLVITGQYELGTQE